MFHVKQLTRTANAIRTTKQTNVSRETLRLIQTDSRGGGAVMNLRTKNNNVANTNVSRETPQKINMIAVTPETFAVETVK